MNKSIGIRRGTDGTVTFDAVEVSDGDNVFWVNYDTAQPHWPGLLYHEVAAFDGIPDPATSALVPISASTFRYICQLHEAANESGVITVYPPLAVTALAPLTAKAGTAYSGALTATGGKPGAAPNLYTWSILIGDLPPGLALSGATITGSPTTAGTYKFTISAADQLAKSATKAFTITVAAST